MARIHRWRSSVTSAITTATTVVIPSTVFPTPQPGLSLVGVGFAFQAGSTSTLADLQRIRFKTDSETFYDQLLLHDRQWKERFLPKGLAELTTVGAANTTFTDPGGYSVWFNDVRQMNDDLADRMSAPIGSPITCELVFGVAPTTLTLGLGLVYSTIDPDVFVRRSSTVLNMAASTTGASREIAEYGNIMAYGVPFTSLTYAATLQRFRMQLRDPSLPGGLREITDGPMNVQMLTEGDRSDVGSALSLVAPAATSVLWKSTRGFELPGGGGANATIDTGTDALTSTEMPLWAYVRNPAKK